MTRPDRVLHKILVARWTPKEAASHLAATFEHAATERPDLFEPYQIRLVGLEEREQITIMREALRDTFTIRHQSRFAALRTTAQEILDQADTPSTEALAKLEDEFARGHRIA